MELEGLGVEQSNTVLGQAEPHDPQHPSLPLLFMPHALELLPA